MNGTLRASYLELEQRRTTLTTETLHDAEQAAHADITILDRLPTLHLNLHDAPQGLQRGLYEATRLSVQVHPGERAATIHISLDERSPANLQALSTALIPAQPASGDEKPENGVDVSMLYVPPVGFEPTLGPF